MAPGGHFTRPTGERVREAAFNSLKDRLAGARVLDLYAGSGAMGLESLSWGAQDCLFVEPNRQAQASIRTNIAILAVQQWAELWPVTAERAVTELLEQNRIFDLIVCDPPWREGVTEVIRRSLSALLDHGGTLLVEHPTGRDFGPFENLVLRRQRKYGGTMLSYWTWEIVP
ncbi:MAG: 16S rRNA (guanine(966)-N(2))-methyltransferase RsmD [Firmicutes bacterium]|nr:16S rRNA (guanine(966)-N(2))-methyltransferase RsmD [Bacillota bacterium]MCL5014413.1 16S rRNA (guanine(966)-N(2))-methyltransferase RsmD [Bacillota bacterium]